MHELLDRAGAVHKRAPWRVLGADDDSAGQHEVSGRTGGRLKDGGNPRAKATPRTPAPTRPLMWVWNPHACQALPASTGPSGPGRGR